MASKCSVTFIGMGMGMLLSLATSLTPNADSIPKEVPRIQGHARSYGVSIADGTVGTVVALNGLFWLEFTTYRGAHEHSLCLRPVVIVFTDRRRVLSNQHRQITTGMPV
jgi:hypothetical protein